MFCIDRLILTAKEQLGEKDARYVKLLKEKKELIFHRTTMAGWKEVIEETVRRLPEHERRVLERFYLTASCRFAAEDLMEALEFEKTHIYRLRDRALKHLGEILEGERTDVIVTVPEDTE
jgi:DNA-directed RNA polymerase specialized sigma subunit